MNQLHIWKSRLSSADEVSKHTILNLSSDEVSHHISPLNFEFTIYLNEDRAFAQLQLFLNYNFAPLPPAPLHSAHVIGEGGLGIAPFWNPNHQLSPPLIVKLTLSCSGCNLHLQTANKEDFWEVRIHFLLERLHRKSIAL